MPSYKHPIFAPCHAAPRQGSANPYCDRLYHIYEEDGNQFYNITTGRASFQKEEGKRILFRLNPWVSLVLIAPIPFIPSQEFQTIKEFHVRERSPDVAEAYAAEQALDFLTENGFLGPHGAHRSGC